MAALPQDALAISAMTGDGIDDLLARIGLLAREADAALPERAAVRGAPSRRGRGSR